MMTTSTQTHPEGAVVDEHRGHAHELQADDWPSALLQGQHEFATEISTVSWQRCSPLRPEASGLNLPPQLPSQAPGPSPARARRHTVREGMPWAVIATVRRCTRLSRTGYAELVAVSMRRLAASVSLF